MVLLKKKKRERSHLRKWAVLILWSLTTTSCFPVFSGKRTKQKLTVCDFWNYPTCSEFAKDQTRFLPEKNSANGREIWRRLERGSTEKINKLRRFILVFFFFYFKFYNWILSDYRHRHRSFLPKYLAVYLFCSVCHDISGQKKAMYQIHTFLLI